MIIFNCYDDGLIPVAVNFRLTLPSGRILNSLVNSGGVSLLVKIRKVKKGGSHNLVDPCVLTVLLPAVHHCSLAILSCLLSLFIH